MSVLASYLSFNGNCAEAFHFYEKALDGKIEMMMKFSESPMAASVPAETGGKIMHASLIIDGAELMGADCMPGQAYEGMKGFSMSLSYPTAEKAKEVFEVLAEGGTIRMPLQATFWAQAFGMLEDRFGTPWMVGCNQAA